MRFMMLMYPGIDTDPESWAPSAEDVAAMTKYNEELTKAGVLLSLDGLRPPGDGARVRFGGGTPTVTDGPFTEAKEVVGGYWLIQASSKEEAVEWATRCPAGDNDFIEVRRVFEMEDFPEDVQAAGQLSERPPEQT
ncbi:MAG TPA: YciI family protein [Solirubrobacterales bacterium]|nr:YciI family protein [Solirubrobacterales bacterium]